MSSSEHYWTRITITSPKFSLKNKSSRKNEEKEAKTFPHLLAIKFARKTSVVQAIDVVSDLLFLIEWDVTFSKYSQHVHVRAVDRMYQDGSVNEKIKHISKNSPPLTWQDKNSSYPSRNGPATADISLP